MTLDDPSGYGRVVRDADGGSCASSRRRRPGDATEEELAIAEVNTGIFAFDGGASSTPSAASGPTTPRASCTCPTCSTCCAPTARPSPRTASTTHSLLLGVNDRVALARVRAHRPAAHPRGAHARRRDDHRPGVDRDRRRRRASAPTRSIEPSTFLRGTTAWGSVHGRPAHDRDRRHPRRRVASCTPTSTSASCGRRRASARSPTCAPARSCASGAKAGTFVEIKNSDIGEGTKVPHLCYIGDADVGAGHQPRRGHDHRQLRRAQQAPHDDRRGRADVGVTRRSSRPSRSATRPTPAPARSSPRTCPPGALAIARARQTNIEGYAERRRSARRRHAVMSPPYTRDVDERSRPQPAMATSLPIDYDKRLMLFSGRANPELAARHRRQARRRPRAGHAQDVLQRRGLLPLRGVDPRRRRLPHPADVRQPRHGHQPERRAHGAARDDRRRRRRVGPPGHRGLARGSATAARTRSPRRASRSARASSRTCSRRRAPTAS